jgi:hypothetical protein
MSVPTAPSLSLCESTHLRQGSILSASLVPRSGLHEHTGRAAIRASSSEDARIEPTARPGQFGLLHGPFGLDDSDQYDVVYGGLDHREPALVAPF